MLRIYVDAATKGNPGPSAGGIVFVGDNVYKQLHISLGVCSNHEAEFKIYIYALEWLLDNDMSSETILIHSDSKIVVQTIEKRYAKNPTFVPYLQKFKQLEPLFPLLMTKWIPESHNKGADNLAKQALRKCYK